MGNSSDKKMEATDDDSTEEMPTITTGEDATKAPSNDSTKEMPVFSLACNLQSCEDATKTAQYLGLTSGFLTGLSGGLFFAGKEYNTMAIITGVVGTLLGYTSYKLWTKEKKIIGDF